MGTCVATIIFSKLEASLKYLFLIPPALDIASSESLLPKHEC